MEDLDTTLQKVEEEAQTSLEKGWELTKKAMGAVLEHKKWHYTKAAEAAYNGVLAEVGKACLGYTLQGTDDGELALHVIGAHINVFDLYRRVGKLDEALELGNQTLDQAMQLEHHTTESLTGQVRQLQLRAGNFLNLVNSAIAYDHIENERYDQARSAFLDAERVFSEMPMGDVSAKNVIMIGSNKAANWLNLKRLDIIRGEEREDSVLDRAESYAGIVRRSLELMEKGGTWESGRMSDQDHANWKANVESSLGDIALYRGQNDEAEKHYRIALEAAPVAEYDTLTACVELKLALVVDDLGEARKYMASVDKFLGKDRDFGVYNFMYMPIVEQVRERLE
ncbi:hypothetical protein ACFL0V_05700 [Nanoarchaeota archaeon]